MTGQFFLRLYIETANVTVKTDWDGQPNVIIRTGVQGLHANRKENANGARRVQG